jgi:hypothetical protein
MPPTAGRRLAALTTIFAGLSFLNLRMKLVVTPAFFDGTLEHNHHLLTAFDYSNNEQSRLLRVTRDRPRLAEFWQWDTNLSYLRQQWQLSPFGWYKATFYFPVFMFGALWLFAYVRWRDKPRFMRASLVTVPLLVASSLVTGIDVPDVDVRDDTAVPEPVGACP